MRFFEIIDQVLTYNPKADLSSIEKAYVFAARAMGNQPQSVSCPGLMHSLAVAGILAQMKLDEKTIVAGMLHDTCHRHAPALEDIAGIFGADVAEIVGGAMKVTRLSPGSRREQQVEYLRKMILAISRDLRVVLVKLADRLNEVRYPTLSDPEGLRDLAHDTLDIYAPLAARLGIDWIKQELEDHAFRILEPEAYESIRLGLVKTAEDRLRYIEEVKQVLSSHFEEFGLQARVSGRPKQLYSVYRKMMRQNLDLDRIHDLTAFRVIVDDVKSCYEALGIVHALWDPVEGRFKDYIVKPKSNMYQSLHTTVIGPYHERMEVQIRTEEMDNIANEGIAAHWLYKEGKPSGKVSEQETQRFSWLREIIELNRDWQDPKAFADSVKLDLYPDEVYVFTPQGEVKVLPKGASPVDFAYEVHTEVGHRCVGARVNGKLVPLRQELRNGDTVEILTATNHRPSKDWLKFVKTSKALGRIRQWMKTEERERALAMGREICERDFRKKGLNFNNYVNSPDLLEVARSMSLKTVDNLLISIAYRKVTPLQVMGKLAPAPQQEEPDREETSLPEKPRRKPTEEGIRVLGANDVLTRMARCCNPVPGEEIVGYITRGRGITVHRLSCKNVRRGDSDRKIDVRWDSGEGQAYPVDIKVTYADDRETLATLSKLLAQMDANVIDIHVDSKADNQISCKFRIEVKDTKHLQRVLAALRSEKNVYRVQRSVD